MVLPAEHTLVIEDSPAGVQAARSAGMLCIGITAGSHAKHQDNKNALIQSMKAFFCFYSHGRFLIVLERGD